MRLMFYYFFADPLKLILRTINCLEITEVQNMGDAEKREDGNE